MSASELDKERAQRPALTYTVTLTEGEYIAVLKAVLAADVNGQASVHLGAKDALVRARYERASS